MSMDPYPFWVMNGLNREVKETVTHAVSDWLLTLPAHEQQNLNSPQLHAEATAAVWCQIEAFLEAKRGAAIARGDYAVIAA